MKEVIQKEGEDRKDYLIRVAIAMLSRSAFSIDTIIYDEAECDALCLVEDLRAEFNVKQPNTRTE